MTKAVFEAFARLRGAYKDMVEAIERAYPGLSALQQRLVDSRDSTGYTVETAAVYNSAMDAFDVKSDIKLILVGDNPGRREQAACNRAYLVGPSGKIAERFFAKNPEFAIDFRRNTLILNKTPVHTPRTVELKTLRSMAGDFDEPKGSPKSGGSSEPLDSIIRRSQIDCAEFLFQFWQTLAWERPVPVWIIGYSEMRKGGIFESYTEAVLERARRCPDFHAALRLYRHFSMNQFTIDLNQKRQEREPVVSAVERIGIEYRARIFPL